MGLRPRRTWARRVLLRFACRARLSGARGFAAGPRCGRSGSRPASLGGPCGVPSVPASLRPKSRPVWHRGVCALVPAVCVAGLGIPPTRPGSVRGPRTGELRLWERAPGARQVGSRSLGPAELICSGSYCSSGFERLSRRTYFRVRRLR